MSRKVGMKMKSGRIVAELRQKAMWAHARGASFNYVRVQILAYDVTSAAAYSDRCQLSERAFLPIRSRDLLAL